MEKIVLSSQEGYLQWLIEYTPVFWSFPDFLEAYPDGLPDEVNPMIFAWRPEMGMLNWCHNPFTRLYKELLILNEEKWISNLEGVRLFARYHLFYEFNRGPQAMPEEHCKMLSDALYELMTT